jgi:hypothetical protein
MVNNWRERLSTRIAIPKSFALQAHEKDTGFQIVEPKDIPRHSPMVSSPSQIFFHEELVNHLLRYDAEIETIKQVHFFRKSNGYVSDQYFTFTIRDQWPFSALMADDFHPAVINLVQNLFGSVFFSRDYYNKVISETGLVLEELPVISLLPLGAGE